MSLTSIRNCYMPRGQSQWYEEFLVLCIHNLSGACYESFSSLPNMPTHCHVLPACWVYHWLPRVYFPICGFCHWRLLLYSPSLGVLPMATIFIFPSLWVLPLAATSVFLSLWGFWCWLCIPQFVGSVTPLSFKQWTWDVQEERYKGTFSSYLLLFHILNWMRQVMENTEYIFSVLNKQV